MYQILAHVLGNRVVPCVSLELTRGKKTKSGGSTRNQDKRPIRKYRGLKASDGQFVHKGDVLFTQFAMRMFPGENVS